MKEALSSEIVWMWRSSGVRPPTRPNIMMEAPVRIILVHPEQARRRRSELWLFRRRGIEFLL